MRQLTYSGARELAWHDVPEPTLRGDDEALVEPLFVASCDLDAMLVEGLTPYPAPIALGHETVARVVDVGDRVKAFAPGDLVAVPFQVSCGECARCRAGRTGNCESVPFLSMYGFGAAGGDWGGALSDLMRVPFADHMLVPIPVGVDPAAVASVSDNIVDGWRTVGPQLADEPGADVFIVGGTASIGLYAAGAAVGLGAARVDYVDTDPVRLERAAALGANALPPEEAGELGKYAITVDAGGQPDGLRRALRATAPDGTCTSVGIYFEPTEMPLLEMYTKNTTFHTGRVHARAHMAEALALVAGGGFRPELVTATTVAFDDSAIDALLDPPGKIVFARHAA
jgi:alcohol dehydrogenase